MFEHKTVRLTPGALRHGYITISTIRDFFPEDSFGRNTKDNNLFNKFTVLTDTGKKDLTDIYLYQRIRERFYDYLNKWYKAGDLIHIYRVFDRVYYLSKVEQADEAIIKECTKTGMDVPAPPPIFEILSSIPKGGIESSGGQEETPIERHIVSFSRIVRDSRIIRELKELYSNRCQICGKHIILFNKSYSEGHHLQQLGEEHNGPDIKENIIIVCPNHHVEFDFGAIAINPDTLRVEHWNPKDEYIGKEIAVIHALSRKYLEYHYNSIFKKPNRERTEEL
jgi:hypothetical protein